MLIFIKLVAMLVMACLLMIAITGWMEGYEGNDEDFASQENVCAIFTALLTLGFFAVSVWLWS